MAPSHADLTVLLKTHVNEAGFVDYRGLKRESGDLKRYLEGCRKVTKGRYDQWSDDEQLAFLINVYNATTLALILDHYPVTSIKKIGGVFSSPWKKRVVSLFGERISLDDLEHGKIRAWFQVPEIHFALVCAARGCPPLRREAYQGAKLRDQLKEQGHRFLSDSQKNRWHSKESRLYLSPIFKWFASDFKTESASVEAFAMQYLPEAVVSEMRRTKTLSIRYTHYDWGLNEWRRR